MILGNSRRSTGKEWNLSSMKRKFENPVWIPVGSHSKPLPLALLNPTMAVWISKSQYSPCGFSPETRVVPRGRNPLPPEFSPDWCRKWEVPLHCRIPDSHRVPHERSAGAKPSIVAWNSSWNAFYCAAREASGRVLVSTLKVPRNPATTASFRSKEKQFKNSLIYGRVGSSEDRNNSRIFGVF